MKDLSDKTGEKALLRPKRMDLNEVRLNGKTGEFVKYELVDRVKGEKVKETTLGKTISLIMLNFRKRMEYYDSKEEQMWQTNEYKKSGDTVYLFHTRERMSSQELWEKYEFLKTRQVIYALLSIPDKEPELVKFIVRGASAIENENTPEGCKKLFTFLGEKKEHSYEIVTKVSSMEEKGKLGGYYVMHFEKLGMLPAHLETRVEETIDMLAEYFNKLDEFYASPKEALEKARDEEETPIIKYDEGEVDPDSIPF